MKIILREDVDNLGRLGDEVEVKAGYARNYLLPQGMAMPATKSNLKVFEIERKKLETKMNAVRAEAKSLAEKLDEAEVVIPVRVGENDKLYGSVTAAMIGDALDEQGLEMDKRKLQLDQPIRSLGEFEIPVKLHADVEATITVKVVRKGGTLSEEEVEYLEESEAAEAPVATEPEAEVETEPEPQQAE